MKIALLFTYRIIVIIFKSVELEHTPSSFPQSKKVISDYAISKKKKEKQAAVVVLFMFLHSQRNHNSKNNKRRSRVNNRNKFAFSLTSKLQEPSASHSESSKQGPRSWITSTRLQAETAKLAWPRGSHPGRSTRVYNVLAYLYADYFDAVTPELHRWISKLTAHHLQILHLEIF